MGLAFGLGSALAWGLADFTVTIVSRRTSALLTVLASHVISVAILGALWLALQPTPEISAAQLGGMVGLGIVGAITYLAFFRALELGPLSVVSPIVSGYAAVTALAAVIILGERPSAVRWIAMAVLFSGVALSTAQLGDKAAEGRQGLILGVFAMFGLGMLLFGIGYLSQDLGWLVPILLTRVVASITLAAVVGTGLTGGVSGRELKAITYGTGLLFLVIAAGDTSGYVSFNVGLDHADASVIATASSAYSIVPIVLGILILGERPVLHQWLGIALVLAGLLGLGLSS